MAPRSPRAGFSVSRHLSERDRRATEQPEARDASGEGAANNPLAGMVEALRSLIGQLSDAAKVAGGASAEPGPGASGGTREFSFGSRQTRAVFGYTLRMGLDGVSAEPFGDVPQKDVPHKAAARGDFPAPTTPAARQPIVEVFEEPGTIVVIAELPGADPTSLVCHVEARTLMIEADGARRYRKRIDLPASVRADDMRQSFQNGILEVRLTPVIAA